MVPPATRRRSDADERSAAGRSWHPTGSGRRRHDRQITTASKGPSTSMNASTLRTSLSSTTNDLLTGERPISRRAMMRGIAGLGALAVAGKLVSPVATAAQVGTARATSDLNLRSGPSTTSKVYRVIPNGATVTLNGRVQNGFQDVTYNGQAGWAHGDHLKPLSGGGGGGGNPQPGPQG